MLRTRTILLWEPGCRWWRRSPRDGTEADFTKATFEDRADFRRTVFGGERDSFTGAVFAGPAEFGTKSAARLAGAEAERGFSRTWPAGREECAIADRPNRAQLTRKDDPGQPDSR
ncbi:pentapeptide repeat-containing protein [Amycolatopsis sp. NBC_01488]|uniref:pentapeptide repeat-containing protein n=1 Tax=Amycolatopsis sp. NBC_01488 TaxID=2903563 RepID=UPI002E2E399B|nr:pentapeptide repeat-containing protein [Amycolatopsis sp. NBC_01488]